MKQYFKSPQAPLIIVIGILVVVIVVITATQHVSASPAPIDPGALSIGQEIETASNNYKKADEAITSATADREKARALAAAKDIELCAKFGMRYQRATLGVSAGTFTEDKNCPLN